MADFTNPFHAHGLSHVSASQMGRFTTAPDAWFAEKILGRRFTPSCAMERGKAIELGVARVLAGDDFASGVEAALKAYDHELRFGGLSGDPDKERAAIEPSVTLAAERLARYGVPDFPEDGQHKIELMVRFGEHPDAVIPVIGYLDFQFEDRVVDLKSTLRMPSTMSLSHRLQAAVYQRAVGNRPVQFCYVTPKKIEVLEPDDVVADQAMVRAIVRRMAAFLALGDKDQLAAAIPVLPDHYTWAGNEGARRELYGM
jgi:hypothetical protein